MIKRIVLAASAAISLALPAAASAQAHFGVSAGASIPKSEFGTLVGTGFNVTGMVNVTIPLSPLGFRGEVGFNRFDVNSGVRSGNGNVRMLNGSLNVVLTSSSIMGAKPYLIGGMGAYNIKGGITNNGLPPSDANTSDLPGNDTRMGFSGGIGLTFGLGPVGTMLEARYASVNGRNGNGSMTFVPVSFGVTF